MVTIKKYGNRRLYDTRTSSYINLADLAAIVREGHEVEVVDAKSGHDLTGEVLLQIVLDDLHGKQMIPVPLLRWIIRASGDDPQQAFLREQIARGMQLFSAQLDHLERLMRPDGAGRPPVDPFGAANAFGSGPPFTGANPFAGANPFMAADSVQPGTGWGPPPSESADKAPEAEPPEGDTDDGLAALRARLAALEERLGDDT